MIEPEFPSVISAKVTKSQYELCKKLATELHRDRLIDRPTVSELLRLVISQLEQKLKEKGDQSFSSAI